METIYLIMITTKTSNIVADLDTLNLISKIIPDYVSSHGSSSSSSGDLESRVISNGFDLIFAFDEAVVMGHKERVSVSQVRHFTSMESHDEERFRNDERIKMLEAKKLADEQRKAIEKKRQEMKKMGIDTSISGGSGSFGGGSSRISPSSSSSSIPKKSFGGGSGTTSSGGDSLSPGKGMQLSAAGKKRTGYSQILAEERIPDEVEAEGIEDEKEEQFIRESVGTDKVKLSLIEVLSLACDNDGGLHHMDIKGELSISIYDDEFNRVQVSVDRGENKGFQFKAHPNMDKNAYSKGILALRQGRAYPFGSSTSILKWRMSTQDEDMIPLRFNVWPSTAANETTVPIDYDLSLVDLFERKEMDLHDLRVTIPMPGPTPPAVHDETTGTTSFEPRGAHHQPQLIWTVPIIQSSEPSGRLEFSLPASHDTKSFPFLPLNVSFSAPNIFADLELAVDCPFSIDRHLEVEQYTVE